MFVITENNEFYAYHKSSKKLKSINKLKGNVVTAFGWNRARSSLIADSVLIGTQKGTIFEISLGEDARNPSDSNCKQVKKIGTRKLVI